MLKRGLIICSLLLSVYHSKAQQYGLFNTKTLFDGFENPAQKVFTLDSSRQYASNFLLPYFGASAASKGNDDLIRKAINTGVYNASNLPIGQNKYNTIQQNSNVYLLTLKIFNSYKYQKELGFSWQIRTDAHVDYTNETLVVLDNYNKFTDGRAFNNVFNDKGYIQSYHQFSMTYRENYDKRLSFGVKLSLLSGTSYNKLNISDSYFKLDDVQGELTARLTGSYKGTFVKANELSTNTFMPTFRNPGASVGFGTSYNSKSGFFLMANVKDLGFIRWNSNNYVQEFKNRTVHITDLENTTPKEVQNQLTDIVTLNPEKKGFYSLTNAKADFMVSKTFGFYTPGFIVSKHLFYKGGDAAMVNKFRYEDFSVTAVPTYNFNNFFMVGVQAMYQTPNFEFFLGSDDLLKTSSQVSSYINKDIAAGNGYNGASVYMGIGIKFGNVVEHPQNSSTMPGLEPERPGLIKRLFSKKR